MHTLIAHSVRTSFVPALICVAILTAGLGSWVSAQGTTGTSIGNWTDVRGTNWVVNSGTADNNVQMWLDPGPDGGQFNLALVQQELATIAAAGFNSIRLFGSFYAHVTNRAAYLTNLAAVLAECRRQKLFVTFVVWDCFGLDGLERAAYGQPGTPGARVIASVDAERTRRTSNLPTLPATMGGTWFAAPGLRFLAEKRNPAQWPRRIRADADAYLNDMATAFRWGFRDVFLSYDVINEPDNLVLVGPSRPDAVKIGAALTAYSMSRIRAIQGEAKFTVGTAYPFFGGDVHKEIKTLLPYGMDYLSYHDYSPDDVFVTNTLNAVGVGQAENLEVVCSEFYTAARQGQLPHVLETLAAAGVGGQMWSAVQDRIFVVHYPTLMSRAFPSSPAQWWVYDSGVYERIVDVGQPTGFRYVAKNPAYEIALKSWLANQTSIVPKWATIDVTAGSWVRGRPSARVRVRGPVSRPVTLLIGSDNATDTPAPGLGRALLSNPTPNVRWLGQLAPTTTPGVGEINTTILLPRTLPKSGFRIQALVGDDYDPRLWERANLTQLTAQILLTP